MADTPKPPQEQRIGGRTYNGWHALLWKQITVEACSTPDLEALLAAAFSAAPAEKSDPE